MDNGLTGWKVSEKIIDVLFDKDLHGEVKQKAGAKGIS
jgi:hypothetical protein